MADEENKPKPKGRGKAADEGAEETATPATTDSLIGSGDPANRFTTQPGDDNDRGVRDVTKGRSERTEQTRLELEAQPRVRFYIPLTPGENPRSTEFVSINGYSLEIDKGKMVELPQQVVDMLAALYNIEVNPAAGIVGQSGQPLNLADADEDTQRRLSQ